MTLLEIWLAMALVVMFVISGFMIWYLRKLLVKFLFISENLGDLIEMINNYQNHLKQLNNMETYHGDETIEYLLRHTNSLVDILEDYSNVYDIIEPLQSKQETITNDNTETEETPKETREVDEENVFYAGTRRGDS